MVLCLAIHTVSAVTAKVGLPVRHLGLHELLLGQCTLRGPQPR